MKKRWFKIIIPIVSVALTVLVGTRIFYINSTAIQQQVEYYKMNQEVALDGCFSEIIDEKTDGYSITVHSAKLTTFGEFAKRFGVDTEGKSYDELTPESNIIDLDVTIKNVGNSDGYIFLFGWGLQSQNDEWVPCLELWEMEFEQTAGSLSFALRPDTEMRLNIPFETNNDYEFMHGTYPVENRYNFVISRAPVKKIITIDL